jgi:cobalt-zinc-cadmium efflux system protein
VKQIDRLPVERQQDLRRARRLEWFNIGFTITIVTVMGLVLGQSQAMKTAWIEDLLGLVPPVVFLFATHYELKEPGKTFPFGFDRVHSLGFLIAAVSLALVGLSLLWGSISSLIHQEHATVASIELFGHSIWLGWLMIAAQAYSIVPPLIIGHREMPLATRLQDEVLFTDAKMNKANWQTGIAGIAGIVGIGLGYWWADAAAAAFISVSIIADGWTAMKVATIELVDGLPRGLGGSGPDEETEQLLRALTERFPDGEVRLRETGRYIRAEVHGVAPPEQEVDLAEYWPGRPDRYWRLADLTFAPYRHGKGGQEAR